MKKLGKFVHVRWRDSRMYLQQCHKDDDFKVSEVISCGYIIAEDKKSITLAGDVIDESGDVRRVIVIPKENILPH